MPTLIRVLLLTHGVVFFAYCSPKASHAQTRERSPQFQWRIDSEVVLPLSNVDLVLESELDLESSLGLAEWQVGPDLGFPLGEHFSGALGYLFEIEPAESVEHGPQGSVTARLPSLLGLSPSVRNRITFGGGSILHRYRGRLRIQREVPWRDQPVSLDLRNEVWYDFGRDAWIRNRLSVGVSRNVIESTAVSVGYQWEQRRDAATIHRMMIGVDLTLLR